VWRGHYAYDPIEGRPHPLTAVAFTLTLEQSWFGRFRGQVEDDSKAGAPEPGMVQGRVFGRRVKFLKWMPVYYVQGEAGLIRLREFMQRQWKMVLDEDLLPPPIYYRGTYDAVVEQVSGTWEIRPEIAKLTSRGQVFECPFPLTTGTWQMARVPG
jgi:hypothetical protein